MPRRARVVIPGLAHHVTQRGNNRQKVFEESADYLNYCRWINKYAVKNRLKIVSFCLMSNHVHFIVIPPDEESLATVFNAAHMRYAQYMNKKRKTTGHLWQGRFYSCVLDEPHLYQAIRYVERNPVRAGIVRMPWAYKWSSARARVDMRRDEDVISFIDGPKGESYAQRKFFLEADEKFEEEIRLKTKRGTVVGSSQFIQVLEEGLGRRLVEGKCGRPRNLGTAP